MSTTSAPTHRTPTTHQQIFHLQHPHPITYDFTSLSTSGLLITIPPHSPWTSELHWHLLPSSCEDISGVSGHYYFLSGFLKNLGDGSYFGSGPMHAMKLKPEMYVLWKRNPLKEEYEREAVTVAYRFEAETANEMYDFYRQVCSVNLDAELYFSLASTPAWLRLWYRTWGHVPWLGKRVQTWAVAWMLWVQLRVIYVKNDYWTYEGRIPFTMPWRWQPGAENPPWKWVERELRSVIVISGLARNAAHWVGTSILGMKEEYVEYGPVRRGGAEQKEKLIDL